MSLFLVLVEGHDSGEAPAAVRFFSEEPLSDLNPVVLVRSKGASPMVIQAAGRIVLGMMERGLPVEGQELAVPVPVTPGVDRPAQWAANAWANLRSARPVDLPHLGSHRTLSFATSAGLVRRLGTWGALLVVAAGTFGCADANPAPDTADPGRSGLSSRAGLAECLEQPEPIRLWRIGRPAAIRRGAVARVADGFVVTGIETEGTGWEAPEADPDRVVRVWSSDGAFLPLPPDSDGIGTGLVTPVALTSERWGLVWGESRPREEWDGAPPPYVVTHLLWSEWADGTWLPSRELAESGHLGWGAARTIRHDPSGGVFMMATAYETPIVGAEAEVLFGDPARSLAPVPLAGYPRPVTGSFDLTKRGEVLVGVIARGEGAQSDEFHALFLRSADGGRTWTDPELVGAIPSQGYFPRDPRLIVDSEGDVHFLWQASGALGDGQLFHWVRRAGGSEWTEALVPRTDGPTPAWAAGLNRCGRLTLARELLGFDFWTIETRMWDGSSWSASHRPFPQMLAAALFEGRGADGAWHLGWTGGVGLEGRSRSELETDAPLWVWAMTP